MKNENKIKDWDNFRKEIEEDLHNNARYKKFFEQYNPQSIERFIKGYAEKKVQYLEHGPRHKKDAEWYARRFHIEAEERLWEIQQKKLFNLQCQWRAEQVEIPEISICQEFYVWEVMIKNCPFLDPISEEDFELYLSYMESDSVEDFDRFRFESWQEYDDYKKEYVSQESDIDSSYPEWYEFYDNRRGTGSLMLLPDTKGEKELFYRNLNWDDDKAKRIAEGTYKEFIPPDKPDLYSWENSHIENFIREYEDPELLKLCRYYESSYSYWNDENLQDVIELLENAGETIPIESYYDWRKALFVTAKNYRINKVREALNDVYEQYLLQEQLGISHYEKKGKEKHSVSLVDLVKGQILKGRELNGEPGDLNF